MMWGLVLVDVGRERQQEARCQTTWVAIVAIVHARIELRTRRVTSFRFLLYGRKCTKEVHVGRRCQCSATVTLYSQSDGYLRGDTCLQRTDQGVFDETKAAMSPMTSGRLHVKVFTLKLDMVGARACRRWVNIIRLRRTWSVYVLRLATL